MHGQPSVKIYSAIYYYIKNKTKIIYYILFVTSQYHCIEALKSALSDAYRALPSLEYTFFLFCVNSDRVKTTLMLLVFVAVCGNAVRSSGASDITLPSGSKFKTREDEEGARYWVRCREVLVRQFFVCLSLEEIGNTGFSLALRASIVNGVPDI